MKNTGQILKEKRESLNLTLSEVALSTKINPKILAAMESGDQQNLPAQTFLKGFVRSYASYLKLDQDALIKSFNQEMGAASPERPATSSPTVEVRSEPVRVERERDRTPVDGETSMAMKSAAVAAIVVLIGVIFGVRELIQKYQKETVVEKPKDLKATPIAETAAPTETAVPPAAAVAPAVTAEPAGTPFASEDPVINQSTPEAIAALATPIIPDELKFPDAKPEEKKPAEVKPEPKIEEPKAEVKPEAKVEPKVEPPKPETPAQAATPVLNSSAKNEIILEALDNVEIRAVIKGQTRKIALGPTQVHTIRTDGSVQFDFSDGGAVNIIVNGRERGVPGDLGKPKQVQIP